MSPPITTYTEAQLEFVDPSVLNRRIATALLFSLLLHALLYGLISPLRKTPPHASQPIRNISVVLQALEPRKNIPEENPAVPEVRAPETPTPITTPRPAVPPANTVVESPMVPVEDVRDESELIGELTLKPDTAPDATALIAKSHEMAGSIATEMEALVDGTAIFDKYLREQLETARRREQADAAVRIIVPPREVGSNQFGDLVIRENGYCAIIPRDFILYTFKEINSIIPMSMGAQCGGGKKEEFTLVK